MRAPPVASSKFRHACRDAGYEDDAEFEDALNGSFDDFLKAMPHLETKIDDQDRLVFKIRPDLPMEEWKPVKMSLRVATREDHSPTTGRTRTGCTTLAIPATASGCHPSNLLRLFRFQWNKVFNAISPGLPV
eukprot:81641-Chlamydomonas_euryale.AAC.25